MSCFRTALAACCLLVSPCALLAEEPLTFERDIRPILRAHCFDCHGATSELKGNLDLRLRRLIEKGGDSGPALEAGHPESSLILERLKSGEMPPGDTKLTAAEIATFERWITGGAKTSRPEPEQVPAGLGITPEERSWWAFQPLKRPEVPVTDNPRLRTPIDSLVARTIPAGLTFNPDAEPRVLMLRLYLDLTGLPPTPEEAARFLQDTSPGAYERLVEELLASPHYGERWGRHWLDVAGYADSDGGTAADSAREWAYKYRDYVIKSFNADKPFDRFLHEQLAGDELVGPITGDLTPEQIELFTATGFLRTAMDGTGSGNNSPEARNQVVADTLKIVTSSLLGMSVACAQCHDHRYDPIPHTDYFALRAIFEPALDWQNWRTPDQRNVSLYTQAEREEAARIEGEVQKVAVEREAKQQVYMAEALEKELLKFEEPLRAMLRDAYKAPADKRTPEQTALLDKNPSVNISPGVLYQYNAAAAEDLKKYDERIGALRATKPRHEYVRVFNEPAGHAPETRLFYRGDYRQPQQVVLPGAMSVLAPEEGRKEFPAQAPNFPTTGRRLAFAQWLTGPDNPLTPRVLVNRVWLHHFGRGLVETPADFGKLGTQPSHPEVLDWLATEFIRQGWSLKQLHRQILLSTVYRQSSLRTAQHAELDNSNRYYARKSMLRIEAELLRDRMLATSGELNRTPFGPAAALVEDETGQITVSKTDPRRSIYIQQRRSQPVAMLQAFDAPVMETNCERRPSSTVATQSLMLMNGDFLLDQAAKLASRAQKEASANVDPALTASLPAPRPPVWQFGYGGLDSEQKKTASFTPLAHWTGQQWQAGAQLPDEKIGWVLLHMNGGHTGENPDRAAIRRWTSPVAGRVRLNGAIGHGSENGDGVRGRVVSSRVGLVGEWAVKNSTAETNVAEIAVEQGDTLDFVVDCRADVNADSFSWGTELTLIQAEGTPLSWKSAEGFHGPLPATTQLTAGQIVRAWELAFQRAPTPEELTVAAEFLNAQLEVMATQPRPLPNNVSPEQQALTNLCQALLSSNEFLYIE